jgi:hypothetical protein
MNIWESLGELFFEKKKESSITESSIWQAIYEAVGDPSSDPRDEFFDYDPSQMHPAIAKKREELQKIIDWMIAGLEKDGTPEMKRVAAKLKDVSKLPVERITSILSQAHDTLFKAKRALASTNPAQDRNLQIRLKKQADAIQDVLKAFPAALTTAANINRSQKSDKGLWQKRMKGYVDKDTGEYIRKGSVTFPTGQDPREIEDEPKIKAVAPVIRKQGSEHPEKIPVKPKWDPAKIGVTIRKKGTT